jgi:myo-inositol catabolism protein IolC
MVLFVLAFDHRNSFRRAFFGIEGTPTPDDERRCREGKAIIFEGLLRAVADGGLPEGQPAILVDDEYGESVVRRAKEAGIPVALPVEQSGQVELAWEHQPFWATLERLDPTYAKALVRYNPDADPELNRRQQSRMIELQNWLTEHGKRFMLELLVPAEPAQLARVAGEIGRYDAELRPALTLEAVRQLGGAGLRPDLWKLEGMNTSAEYGAIGAEIRSNGGERSRCLVLGRGADPAAVERWLRLAAPIPGFGGFAVGRTIWWDPLKEFFAGHSRREEATALIAMNYRHFVDVYLDARQSESGDAADGDR